ncbi:mRNA-binding WHI3 [Fusarium phyllophilum]|uniref:mRNA-binding WHI3 n=1 Tax=Fusarium phyllophilum TaxID=47803 RepID=A0A8H5NFP5_9HYPO|nr:mRNA-binding WHI3 [Fusarium phyllophilum]
MKVSAMLVFPALALAAATPKLPVSSIDPACLESITSVTDCIKNLKPAGAAALTDVATCLAEIVAGIQKCIPGVPGGLPSGLPTGIATGLPTGLPVPLPTPLPGGLPGNGTPGVPEIPGIPGLP